jgi:DNA-binding NarL/FixJ family response regulator
MDAKAPTTAPVRPGGEGDLDTIRSEVAGLTPTQLKVLLAVLEGQLNKQIAHSLGIAEATVKAHDRHHAQAGRAQPDTGGAGGALAGAGSATLNAA